MVLVGDEMTDKWLIGGFSPHISKLVQSHYESLGIIMPAISGGIPTPLKNMSSSVGMITFPILGNVIKFMFQTTNQYFILILYDYDMIWFD